MGKFILVYMDAGRELRLDETFNTIDEALNIAFGFIEHTETYDHRIEQDGRVIMNTRQILDKWLLE